MQTSWTTVFEPVDASSTYQETVTRLGTAIRIGVLEAGSRLPPERELAEQLAISRSTLRQALATLTATGHLKAVRGRAGGTFVAATPPVASGDPFPREDLRPLLDTRLALELGAAQLAAERVEDADRGRLEEAVLTVEEARSADFAAYRRADANFHLAVAATAHSPHLVAELAHVQGRLSDILSETGVPADAREEDVSHHRRLVGAIAGGDAAEAVAAMREHLDATEQMVQSTFKRR